MRMQMRQSGGTVIFHMLRAPLKIHNYGRKPTFSCFLQQMSQWATGLGRETLSLSPSSPDSLSPAAPNWLSICAEGHLGPKRAVSTSVLPESFPDQAMGHPPSIAAGQHIPGPHPMRITIKIGILGTHYSPSKFRVWLPIILFGHRPVETHVLKSTHLLQCFWM